MEIDHCCKVCGGTFLCGRSLARHMRSHAALGSSMVAEENPVCRYGLRANPKKTWRLNHGSPENATDMLCPKCGAIFPSWSSLFQHMKCHNWKDEEDSWSNGTEEDDEEIESQPDSEATASAGPRWKMKRRRLRRIAAISASSPEYEKEQEDGALCLMMLSRGGSSVTDSSDKVSSAMEETEKRSNSRLLVIEIDSQDEDGDQAGKNSKSDDRSKRRKYECRTCGKIFDSHQGLGGHLSSQARLNYVCQPAGPSPEKSRAHECSICGKNFASGQALGGHMRRHMLAGNRAAASAVIQIVRKKISQANFPDLNLPAPDDFDCEKFNGRFESWV
ncbi:Zinc finger protein ZAT4 [Apostasia shenzhenica]|uniref:Zinc finger protein ZAT4 n=1 Tax=Apostasia shenzhenica TaxID=1088818 RepID=A0A2I0ADQ8_9ASPA|nr:Zinc finger protein ZAT4 [Apostasia shenzhenica]